MPRAPRVWFPSAWYHIVARGNNKEPVFFADRDYLRYLRLLRDALVRCEARVHAYALMNNHVHLMIETGKHHSVAKLMQWLHTTYTGYINYRYKRFGHLFQGRYKSILIDKDTYALEVSRYIHLNPVRARLVRDPIDYRWTSYHAYLDSRRASFITTELVLGLVSRNPESQIELYRQFISNGSRLGSDPKREILELPALGSDPRHLSFAGAVRHT